LRKTFLNGFDHAAHRVDLLKVIQRACFHLVSERLNEIRTTERVDSVSDAGLFTDYLLRAQRNQRSSVSRQCEGFIVCISVQRLRTAKHARERLNCHANDIVQRLLDRQRDAGCLSVKAHLHCALVDGAKTIAHHSCPNSARGAVLRDLFEKIVVGVEEKRNTWNEPLQIQSSAKAPVNIFNSIAKGECQFL